MAPVSNADPVYRLPPEVQRAFAELRDPRRVELVPSGLSGARVLRVEAPTGRYAVKACQQAQPDAARDAWVASELSRANRRTPHMARPYTTLHGEPAFFQAGHSWQVRDWIEGSPATPATADVAVRGLAALHAAWSESTRVADLPSTLPSISPSIPPPPVFATRLAALEAAADDPVSATTLETGARALAIKQMRRFAREVFAVQTVHGDARPENARVREGKLAGWIDDGALAVDTPWRDVARLTGELADGDAAYRDQLVRVYAEASGTGDRAPCELVGALDLAATVIAVSRWRGWLAGPDRERWQEVGGITRREALEWRLDRLLRASSSQG
ncbi:hypothetical protein [Botrimarina hoheduenensis]|uniref:Phosphotransferase enzyme family protein n=1 Tax=Botrimarina hoheduenensis TaxID=2528000 RepID=A0A5C5WB44_9BACT|nr:hypothetical protein [Botrimarina hoheduenensis]TWT47814.1 hypothetical protein Pla111_14370 [Botrimarina hoheduenensis]